MQPDTGDDRREKENDPQEACLNPVSSMTDPNEQVDSWFTWLDVC